MVGKCFSRNNEAFLDFSKYWLNGTMQFYHSGTHIASCLKIFLNNSTTIIWVNATIFREELWCTSNSFKYILFEGKPECNLRHIKVILGLVLLLELASLINPPSLPSLNYFPSAYVVSMVGTNDSKILCPSPLT